MASFGLLNFVMSFKKGHHVKPLHLFGITGSTLVSEAVPSEWFDIRFHSK